MTRATGLTARQSAQLITALRHGQPLDEAAADLRLDLAAVWATARANTRIVVALAGRDPDAAAERGRGARAEYLRLLALGVPSSTAELTFGLGPSGELRYMVSMVMFAEMEGDVTGTPETVGVLLEQCQDSVTATLGDGGVPVVAGDSG